MFEFYWDFLGSCHQLLRYDPESQNGMSTACVHGVFLAVSQLGEPASFYHLLEMQANYVLTDTGWQEAQNQRQCMLLLHKATNQTAPCPCGLLPSLQNQTAPCGLPRVSATSLAVYADAGQAAAACPTCMPISSLENYVFYIL
jgi:hypothetical protein